MSDAPVIEASSLTKHFGRVRALDGIDLSVPRGSVFGLIGPNGAGKTTTFGVVCGWVHPTGGSVKVLGHKPGDVKSLKGKLGALPQDAALPPHAPLAETLAHYGRLQGLPRKDAGREADRVLELVGLSEWRRMRCGALSHGMAKRAGIAQAFIGGPELVLLDEPTAGLDPKSAHHLRKLLADLTEKATLVISSHNLFELEKLCDHAAILDKGHVVAAGPMGELTEADSEVIVVIGDTPDAVVKAVTTAVEALEAVNAATFEKARGELIVRYAASEDPRHTISAVLSAVLGAGAQVGEVRRGRGLEARVLEMT